MIFRLTLLGCHHMKQRFLAIALLFFLGLFFVPAKATDSLGEFPVVYLKIGSATVKVEVAKTEQQRAKGLMFRKHLGKNSGMLFDFGAQAQVCMWMKNTYIPLSVAFIDQDGMIVNIEDMEPLTTDSHCSSGLIVYALEMNRGWFATNKIQQGDKIQLSP